MSGKTGRDVHELVIFSDLDGTLLDHASYSWAAAQPALDALAARHVPLVLATSKTAAEVAVLHAALGLGTHPAIVENGAGVFRPGTDPGDASAYRAIRQALDALPTALRTPFRGFGDMDDAEVAAITGLPPGDAARARRRQFSEPGLWTGDAPTRAAFLEALKTRGIAARAGGRFLTLSPGRTKADALREVAADLCARQTVALGDAPNDIEMLQAADRGVIVRNDHGPGIPSLPGEAAGTILRTRRSGPAGWNDAVLDILNLTGG